MKRNIIIIVVLLAFVLVGYLFYEADDMKELQPKFEVVEVRSELSGGSLYLKRETRGLNYAVTVISTSPSKKYKPDVKTEFVYSIDDPTLFYKVNKDTLIVYTFFLAKEPIDFRSGFKVKQIKIENAEYHNFVKNYSEKGLLKF